MRIWAIGDLHLSFTSDKPMDIYGSQWDDHARRLKENWTALVEPEDVVILAGDHSWALKRDEATTDLAWLAALPGRKVLIKGNHDLWWTSAAKLNLLDPSMQFLQNTCIPAGSYGICGTRGWILPGDPEATDHDRKIYQRELGRLRLSLEAGRTSGAEELIAAIHFPPATSLEEGTGFTDLFEEYGVTQVVYGHLHGPDAQRKGIQGVRNGVAYSLVACDHLACRPLLVTRG